MVVMKTTRYNTVKVCKCGAGKTSALATYCGGTGPSLAADSPVFIGKWGGIVIKCKGCGEERDAKRVKGVFSAKHVCSAKCLASTGFSCECSCGGKNHGASHAA
jgi:hypothetical protein